MAGLEYEGIARAYLTKYSKVNIGSCGLYRVTGNAREFSQQLARLSAFMGNGIDAVVRKTCLDLYRRIVERTPVETGRARASWGLAMENKGDSAPKDFNDAGSKSSRGLNAARDKMEQFSYLPLGDEIIIYNNLVYIEPLENGWSFQAPAGMVAISLAEFSAHLRKNFDQLGY